MERRRTRHPGAFNLFPERWGRWEPVQLVETALANVLWYLSWPVRYLEKKTLLRGWSFWLVTAVFLLLVGAASFSLSESAPARFGGGVVWAGPSYRFSRGLEFGPGPAVDAAVGWAQLETCTSLHRSGAGHLAPARSAISSPFTCSKPLTRLLQGGLSWPVVMLLVLAAAYQVSGRGLAVAALIGMLLMGALGMWNFAMETLAQVIVAVLISVTLGIPLGIWSARSQLVENLLRPLLDFLQTIPPFVYLVPVIMLFNTGSVPGIIASVLYAIPPVISVDQPGYPPGRPGGDRSGRIFWLDRPAVVEQSPAAAGAAGDTLGVNQTVMMVLAMVIIAGLIGGGGLGYEVVYGLAQNELGRGVEAGIAIVIMAVIIDRLTQGRASRRREAANL